VPLFIVIISIYFLSSYLLEDVDIVYSHRLRRL